ncbi:unnamed protein product [Camellia sinensis]
MLYAVSAPKTCISYQRSPLFRRRYPAPTRLRVSASLSDPNGVKVEYTPWLIVGLGNPGSKYHETRHNVGFEMIDCISQVEGVQLNTIQSKALVVKSVMDHLDGCREFPRLCIGIGNPPGSMDMKAYLLQKFSLLEQKQVDAALQQGVDAVRNLVLNGFNNSTTRFNLEQKYKYHKV